MLGHRLETGGGRNSDLRGIGPRGIGADGSGGTMSKYERAARILFIAVLLKCGAK
jgi:hypothetical protein